MSMPTTHHLVLARRYRPSRFDQMVGQAHVVRALSNALSTGRLHHAYLFTGTRGVGKTTVSRILAKSLNCIGPDEQGDITAEPCGQCAMCQAIDQGRFLDYTELDAASNRGVDEIQSLLEQAVYKPVEGRFKVFMIDEVHMLTNTAFNAMLKTLEEPPAYLKFVLATTDPQKVPVTVLSRCLQFNLRPLAPDLIAQHLAEVLTHENLPFEPAALDWLARGARGSMRDALSLTDQAIAFGGGSIQESTVQEMLGAVGKEPIYALIAHLAQGNGKAIVEAVVQLREGGFSASATLDEIALVLHQIALWQATQTTQGQTQMSAAQTDRETHAITQLAQQMPADEVQLLYSLCLHGRNELGLGPDEYATLNMILLRPLAFRISPPSPLSSQPLSPPLSAAPSIQPPLTSSVSPVSPMSPMSSVASPVTHVTPVAPLASGLSETTDVGDWSAVVVPLLNDKSLPPLVRELARQSQLLSQEKDPGIWVLRVASSSLAQEGLVGQLQAALQALGHDCRLRVEIGAVENTPAQQKQTLESAQADQALQSVLADPLVQQLTQQFGASVVPKSIRLDPP
jgi:DNA polymerase-3 subunit gamma/tau